DVLPLSLYLLLTPPPLSPSFPTRRSSDLPRPRSARAALRRPPRSARREAPTRTRGSARGAARRRRTRSRRPPAARRTRARRSRRRAGSAEGRRRRCGTAPPTVRCRAPPAARARRGGRGQPAHGAHRRPACAGEPEELVVVGAGGLGEEGACRRLERFGALDQLEAIGEDALQRHLEHHPDAAEPEPRGLEEVPVPG